MIVLAAETSTKNGSVALAKDGKVLGEKINLVQKSHSEVIHQFINELLVENKIKITDVDLFAASVGPGSFTGLRIAGNAMKTFSYALNKPMVAVDSLQLLAQAFPEDGIISPWINAYKNMVYWGLFEKKNGQLHTLKSPDVIRIQEISSVITQPTWVLGDGYTTYAEFLPEPLQKLCLRPLDITYDFPYSRTLALLSFDYASRGQTIGWNSFQPLYIRASEAEENKSGIRFTSLR